MVEIHNTRLLMDYLLSLSLSLFFVLPVDGGVLSMPHLSSYVVFGWTDGKKKSVICSAKKKKEKK